MNRTQSVPARLTVWWEMGKTIDDGPKGERHRAWWGGYPKTRHNDTILQFEGELVRQRAYWADASA